MFQVYSQLTKPGRNRSKPPLENFLFGSQRSAIFAISSWKARWNKRKHTSNIKIQYSCHLLINLNTNSKDLLQKIISHIDVYIYNFYYPSTLCQEKTIQIMYQGSLLIFKNRSIKYRSIGFLFVFLDPKIIPSSHLVAFFRSIKYMCGLLANQYDIFIFESQQYFLSIEMDRQERYVNQQYEYDGDNLLSSILNGSSHHQQLIQIRQDSDSQVENYQENVPAPYHDILNKEESNCMLPEELNQELGEQLMMIITPSSKKTQPEISLLSKKDYKIDKSAYKQQTRQVKINRYLSKKSRRIWGRKVSYDCRKVVADKRQRLNGRFIKKSPSITNNPDILMTILANEQLQMLMDYQQSYKYKNNHPFTLD